MNNIIAEVNCTTGEVIHREMTPEEVAVRVENARKAEEDRLAKEAAEAAKVAAKASAESKLAALGLTAEEIAALTK